MLLDQRHLLLSETARLLQYAIPMADLADIVQQRAHADLVSSATPTSMASAMAQANRSPGAVFLRVAVAGVESAGERIR